MAEQFIETVTSKDLFQPRMTSACDFCKRLHIKCDGQAVCSNCLKRELVCVYSTSKRRSIKEKRLKIEPDQPLPTKILPVDDIKALTKSITQFIRVYGPDPHYSWIKDIPSLDLINYSNADLTTSKLVQKFILFGIAANGAALDRDFSLAESYYVSSREIFSRFFGYSSVEFVIGMLLLEEYTFKTGKIDECVCYPVICNQLMTSIVATSPPTVELNTLYCHVLSIVTALSLDREDRYHYYTKGRKIANNHFEVLRLSTCFCHGEITHQIDKTWDMNMICAILDESEQLSQISNVSDADSVNQLLHMLIISAHRAAVYWKIGKHNLSRIWSTKATELSFDMRLNYYHHYVMVAIGLITKLHIQGGHYENLEQNLKILSILKEYFPFISDLIQEVRKTLRKRQKHPKEAENEESYSYLVFEVPELVTNNRI